MREIKFRAKREDNGEWITGSETYIRDSDGVWLCDPESLDVLKVVPETVGQFTGLYDKNGVPIYEGDIVQRWQCRYEVCWDDFTVGFAIKNEKKLYSDFFAGDGCYYCVIGNIHDSPGLME